LHTILLLNTGDLVRTAPAVLLAVALLLSYQLFRERYLLPWAAGWAAYALGHVLAGRFPGVAAVSIEHLGFSLALLLFVGGTLAYLKQRRLLLVAGVLAVASVALGVVRAVWFPDSTILLALMHGVCGAQAGLAAVQVVQGERGRRGIWQFVYAALLVLFSVAGNPVSDFPESGRMTIELLLGMGMALATLGHASGKLEQLRALGNVIRSISRASDPASVSTEVLADLMGFTRCRAGWIRMLQNSNLVLKHSVGLEPTAASLRPVVGVDSALSGRVVREGGPLIVRRDEADEATAERMAKDGFEQIAIFAVYGTNSVIGTITLATDVACRYSQDELRLVESAARQLGITLEDLHMQDELRERNRELYALNSIADIAAQSFDLDQILNASVRQIMDLFPADTAAIYVLEPSTHILHRKAAWGFLSDLGKEMTQVTVQPELWKRLQRRDLEVLGIRHRNLLPQTVRELIAAERLQTLCWVILRTEGNVVGVMALSSRDPAALQHEPLMVALGRQLAITIEKVQLYSETSQAYEEIRRTQEQLLQTEKMAAMGQLVAGVAHELNNPLTAIIGYAQLLESGATPEQVQDYSQKLHRQARRTHKVVQNLLSFSRQHKAEKADVDIVRVLEDTIALREYDLRLNNIEVVRDYAPALLRTHADANQLEQVFLNILNNAVDAMLGHARGGMLRVRTSQMPGKVCVQVHDSGPGIKEPQRVFDPFYTTKEIGKGTGLGLSICYGIVSNHGGEITAYNHPEGGAVFEVKLPLVTDLTAVGDRAGEKALAPAAIRARILMIDDEEAVLEFESEVLAGAGAEVAAFTRCEDALRMLSAESFDLLIVDGKMPGGWSCQEVYDWVAEHDPRLLDRMVLALSSLNDSDIRAFLERTRLPYLVKPFGVSDLLRMVRQSLEKAGTSRSGREAVSDKQ
jgi:signal transduction histidine kinase